MTSTPDAPAALPARGDSLLRASRHPLAAVLSEGLADAGVSSSEQAVLLVSGGGDSLALLVLMAALRERSDRSLDSLAVLTINHGLRPEAAEECAHAIAVARMLGVERAEVVRVEVERTGNLLDAARAARLAAVAEFAARHAIPTALLAHHADDLAESVLIGLERGAGLASLVALLPHREHGPLLRLVRPLLRARRAELRAFLAEIGLSWHDDPSNALHARGRLRSDPALAALVDSIARGAVRLSEEARELIAFRDAEIARLLSASDMRAPVSRAALEAVPPSLLQPLLRALLRREGVEASTSTLSALIDAIARKDRAPKRFSLRDGAAVELDARRLAVTRGPRSL